MASTNNKPKTTKARKAKNRLAALREGGIVLSQEQVGTLMGLDATTVSRHESGARGITRDQIDAYAKLYGVPTHEIFFLAPEAEDGETAVTSDSQA